MCVRLCKKLILAARLVDLQILKAKWVKKRWKNAKIE